MKKYAISLVIGSLFAIPVFAQTTTQDPTPALIVALQQAISLLTQEVELLTNQLIALKSQQSTSTPSTPLVQSTNSVQLIQTTQQTQPIVVGSISPSCDVTASTTQDLAGNYIGSLSWNEPGATSAISYTNVGSVDGGNLVWRFPNTLNPSDNGYQRGFTARSDGYIAFKTIFELPTGELTCYATVGTR